MGRKEILIQKNDAGQRVDKFLTKTFPNLPQSMLYKSIRKKDIKLNGKRCEISTKLQENDKLSLFLKDEFYQTVEKEQDFLKAPVKLSILYEDENILLVDKKPGLIVHPDETYHFDSLIARIQHYLYEKGEYRPEEENSFAPALVNRIDRNTGGIVITAKNAKSLRILNEKMKHREMDKRYLCLVHGTPRPREALLDGYLEKNESKNRVFVTHYPTEHSKPIQTLYQVQAERGQFSLVEVVLLTGRTHQIRAHMASIGHPLVGDGKYGTKNGTNEINRNLGFPYQALYSYQLTFTFAEDAGILQYLDGQTFTADAIWFLSEFKKMGPLTYQRKRKS